MTNYAESKRMARSSAWLPLGHFACLQEQHLIIHPCPYWASSRWISQLPPNDQRLKEGSGGRKSLFEGVWLLEGMSEGNSHLCHSSRRRMCSGKFWWVWGRRRVWTWISGSQGFWEPPSFSLVPHSTFIFWGIWFKDLSFMFIKE